MKHKLNLELYVPKNYISKPKASQRQTKPNKTQIAPKPKYLRDKLIAFDTEYQARKDYLDQIRENTEAFSQQYHQINKEEDSTAYTSRLTKAYDKVIEVYKANGYNEDKLIPKKNVFEPSMLLAGHGRIGMIIENEDLSQLNKEKRMLNRFTGEVTKVKKGELLRQSGKRIAKVKPKMNTNGGHMVELPVIERSSRAITEENRVLYKEICKTKKSLHELFASSLDIIDDNEGNGNKTNTYDNSVDIDMSTQMSSQPTPNKPKDNETKGNNTEVNKQSSSKTKGYLNIIRRMKGNGNEKRNISMMNPIIITEPNDNQNAIIPNLKKLNENLKKIINRSVKKVELEDVYKTLRQGDQETNAKNIKSYLIKYTKKRVEPIQLKKGANLHGLLNDCVDKITISNLPDLIHHFKQRNGASHHSVSDDQLDKMSALDVELKDLEHASIRKMLSVYEGIN